LLSKNIIDKHRTVVTIQVRGNTFPHPRPLSRRERGEKPFSLREKGGDEGGFFAFTAGT
jgi:hypothetical protein